MRMISDNAINTDSSYTNNHYPTTIQPLSNHYPTTILQMSMQGFILETVFALVFENMKALKCKTLNTCVAWQVTVS